MLDPITDMFNRIKNAQAVMKKTVEVPFSNIKQEIAMILEKNGFILKAEKKGKALQKFIEIELKYEKGAPAILEMKRVSKSSQRIYSKSRDLRQVRTGYGISIISTSRGLMTNKDAKRQKLGGEIICQVW